MAGSKEDWSQLKAVLSSESIDAITELGFMKPTPVQSATIPLFAQNKDVVVEAVTGSGKTLAFLLPVLEILKKRKQGWKQCEIGALVISPTRELATQIGEALVPFLEKFGLRKAVFTGGASDSAADAERFRSEGGNIIIGTPGRLEDLLNKYPHLLVAKSMEVLVLDEADRLLDMGFERTLNNIISKLPKQRRTGLFSATMTNAVSELIRTGLRNPVKVTVKVEGTGGHQGEQKIPDSLKIFYHLCPVEERLSFLLDYLEAQHKAKTMVYFGTCACVDYFAQALGKLAALTKSELKFVALHGKMEHKRRSNVFKEFVNSPSAVLLCTDLAARGLDFPDIDLVVQFDAPQDPASFVHRCGRTARSGREGIALLVLDPKEEAYVDFMEARKVPLQVLAGSPVSKHPPAEVMTNLIKINSSDRDLYEKSLKAFVSYIRFYQEHHAKFIFDFKELDISGLARSFGLLHMPRMPELKQFPDINFTAVDVDVSKIKFTSKAREKQRKVSIARRALEEPKQELVKRKALNESWSGQKERKEKRHDRREKKAKKRDAIAASKNQDVSSATQEDDEDADDMDDEYRALKKEKRAARSGSKHGQLSGLKDSDIDSE